MSRITRWMDEHWYPDQENNWDDKFFREQILSRLQPEFEILDMGAGVGIVSHMNFRGSVARVCGIDPSVRVHENPHLDEAKEGLGENIPYPDESFDLVFSDNVLEHLAEPASVFREVHRVLKPGGYFLAKTPNYCHYVAGIARVTPHWFHQFYSSLRGRAPADTFPTHYRANSQKTIQGLAKQTGFDLRDFNLIEGRPEYLRLTAVTYTFGWLYERLVNSSPRLEGFRVVLITTLQKK